MYERENATVADKWGGLALYILQDFIIFLGALAGILVLTFLYGERWETLYSLAVATPLWPLVQGASGWLFLFQRLVPPLFVLTMGTKISMESISAGITFYNTRIAAPASQHRIDET